MIRTTPIILVALFAAGLARAQSPQLGEVQKRQVLSLSLRVGSIRCTAADPVSWKPSARSASQRRWRRTWRRGPRGGASIRGCCGPAWITGYSAARW